MRTIRIAQTIQDEMEQRWLGLPWYLDRLEFCYAAMGSVVVAMILWPFMEMWLAVLIAAVFLPLWMWAIAWWKSGKEPGYRWDTAYRLGLLGRRQRWLPRVRGRIVRLSGMRRSGRSVFAGTVQGGLCVGTPGDEVALPTLSPTLPMGQVGPPVLPPEPALTRRVVRRMVQRDSGPAPGWFQALSEVPEGRTSMWLVRPTIPYGYIYDECGDA